MKKFTIPCNFGGQKANFDVYIGNPKDGNHPLQNQANWLSTERGGQIPPEIMESFAKLLQLSKEKGVSFEDLCVYALEAANKQKELEESGSDEGGDEAEKSAPKAAEEVTQEEAKESSEPVPEPPVQEVEKGKE